MKRTLGIFLLAVMLMPAFALAETNTTATSSDTSAIVALKAKITTLETELKALHLELRKLLGKDGEDNDDEDKKDKKPLPCVALTNKLRFGTTDGLSGGEVSKLQEFLAGYEDVYPEKKITGFYGRLTEEAVKRFQAKHGIVTSGNADTTGYGAVGPSTRARIVAWCKGRDVLPPTIDAKGTLHVEGVPTKLDVGATTTLKAIFQPAWSCPQGRFCAMVMPAPKEAVVTWMLSDNDASVNPKYGTTTTLTGEDEGSATLTVKYDPANTCSETSSGDLVCTEIGGPVYTATYKITIEED